VKHIVGMTEGVHKLFMRSLYETVHEATERSGNIVDVKEIGSIPEAFLEMLRRIEFSVSQDGSISRPEVHLSPDMYEKFAKEIEGQDEQYKKEIENITRIKETEAIERESARKSRFRASDVVK
tara:strand:+ start:154 stop:522 length:369 start_codon:yes stop_codon:yes gene_type:complete